MANDAVAGDVPGRFDVVINSQGYVFLDSLEPSLPFRTHRATFSSTPTFISRTNTSGNYGDNTQDFFLTASQNNWDLGGNQRYFRSTDSDRVRRFWKSSNADVTSIPGQVTTRYQVGALTFAGAVRACTESTSGVYTSSSSNLYLVNSAGSITDEGAHGLGATPSQWGMAFDGTNVYLSTTSAGTVGVRKWNGSAYSTFGAVGSDSLAYLNNSLYGYSNSSGSLQRYDTSGTATTLFTWKDASGSALTGSSFQSRLRPDGGKLLILRTQGSRRTGELWTYDGTNTSQIADFPSNFVASDCEIVDGIVFVTGYLSFNSYKQPAIYYYVNGATGQLWRATATNYTNATWPAVVAWGDGLAFTDDTNGLLMQYNLATGGVHAIGSYSVTNATPLAAANKDILLHTRNSTAGYYYPTSTLCTSSYVASSLFDFDNSLPKTFRGIKADFDIPAGSTATVDLAYQVDSVDGAYTTLQTGATSGTEYTLTSVSGHSLSVKVTLNTGNATTSPVLKRVYVRAAPQLQTYKQAEYIFDMSGTSSSSTGGVRTLRDGTPHPKTGAEQVNDILTAMASGPGISITDPVNGTFTGMIVPESTEFYLIHPGVEDKGVSAGNVTAGEYVGKVTVRQV